MMRCGGVAEISESVLGHLRFLYGENVASQLAGRLEVLYGEYGVRTQRRNRNRTGLGLTETDALLITYADQVQEPGQAPLTVLTSFAHKYLRGVVSGIHLLPFYPSSSDDGFSVKDYSAVDPGFGSWDEIARLNADFNLMFDAVFNHMSAASGWFQRFLTDDPAYRDFFITVAGSPDLSQVVRPRTTPLLTEFQTGQGLRKVWTTFSADQVDLNFKNPEVLMAVLRALLFYVSKGARFIRLDAIAFLWKEVGTSCLHLPQTHRIVQLMRGILDDLAPHVLLITETNVPHRDNLSYFGDGYNEAQLVYNFALPPLVLHSLLAGDTEKLNRWAQTLALPSDRITFFNFLASHDGIGLNPGRGILSEQEITRLVERTTQHGGLVSYKNNPDGTKSPYELNISWFDAVNNPFADEPQNVQVNRFLVSQAILLAMAGVPGIYFHSLFGSRNDRAAADASGIPRRINRQKLERATLQRELGDKAGLRTAIFTRYSELLRLRRSCPAFHPLGDQEVIESDPRVFALLRTAPDGESKMLCLHNLSNQPVRIPALGLLSLCEWRWENAFSRQEGMVPSKASLQLRPFETLWLSGKRRT